MKIPWMPIKDFIIPVLTMGISGFIGTWLFHQYLQPQVVYYTDEYYSKLRDSSVGSIFIVNEGKTPETNLSILIGETIPTSDISIGYISGQPIIVHQGSKTRVTIPNLKPRESAEIVFRSHSEKDTFSIEDVTSDSGNIRHEEWTRPWWYFTKLQLGIIFLAVALAFLAGYLVRWSITRTTRRRE